ncbi:hypothetical protein [Lentzea nigeriaca]|uniref:hypothetical protein n=1 Tax=Lentzea nigeriaca TaxID=1128665 RepID=UPI0019592351|nr:hypothetical protein [Lentzea nigeriaca]MBM7864114.1 hypothetical protein [Lentzea nigeriaca]
MVLGGLLRGCRDRRPGHGTLDDIPADVGSTRQGRLSGARGRVADIKNRQLLGETRDRRRLATSCHATGVDNRRRGTLFCHYRPLNDISTRTSSHPTRISGHNTLNDMRPDRLATSPENRDRRRATGLSRL